MHERNYMLHQAVMTFWYSSAIAFAIISIGIYQLYKIWKGQRWFDGHPDDEKKSRLPVAIAMWLLGGAMMIGFTINLNKSIRISNNFAQTIGTVDKRLPKSKFHYWFRVNNKIYDGAATQSGQLIDVRCPGGRYPVVYNSKDPSESEIDFDYGPVGE